MTISSVRCFRLFVDDKLAKHCRIMREIVRRARNATMRDFGIENDKDTHFILMSSMARAVAIGDVKCIRIVMHTYQIAVAMFVVEEGRVIFKNPASFFEILTNAKNGVHPTKSDAKVKKRKKGGNASAARSMQQWPFFPRGDLCFFWRQEQRWEGCQRRDLRSAIRRRVGEAVRLFGRVSLEFARFLSDFFAFVQVPDGLLYVAWKQVGAHGLETLTELELFVRQFTRTGWNLRARTRYFSLWRMRLAMPSSVSGRFLTLAFSV